MPRNSKQKNCIKSLITRVNVTIPHYEKDWVSARRTLDENSKVRCSSITEFLEVRINFEAFSFPEFKTLAELTDGHAFFIDHSSLVSTDLDPRKFESVKARLIDPSQVDHPEESLILEIEKVRKYLGGNVIVFNSKKQKIKVSIENEK